MLTAPLLAETVAEAVGLSLGPAPVLGLLLSLKLRVAASEGCAGTVTADEAEALAEGAAEPLMLAQELTHMEAVARELLPAEAEAERPPVP